MLTMNSPFKDFCDLIDKGMEIRNECGFFYYKYDISSTTKSLLEKIVDFYKNPDVIPDNIQENKMDDKATIIYMDLHDYSDKNNGKYLNIVLFIDNEKCRMKIRFKIDGELSSYPKYLDIYDIISEKLSKFLN